MSRVAFDAYLARIRTASSIEALGSISRAITDDQGLEGYEKMNLWDAAARRGKELEPEPFKTPAAAEHVDVEIPKELATSELVVPVATPELARAAWASYKALAAALEEPEDLVTIEGHAWRRKSFWRKIALAYGLDLELVHEERRLEHQPSGEVRMAFYVQVRASSRTGRHADGVGSCSSLERKGERKEHDIYATAYTRAANRAIADLVAAGEVSAEEVE